MVLQGIAHQVVEPECLLRVEHCGNPVAQSPAHVLGQSLIAIHVDVFVLRPAVGNVSHVETVLHVQVHDVARCLNHCLSFQKNRG